jgi:hypothetical protein
MQCLCKYESIYPLFGAVVEFARVVERLSSDALTVPWEFASNDNVKIKGGGGYSSKTLSTNLV